jgi:hypothetical protein
LQLGRGETLGEGDEPDDDPGDAGAEDDGAGQDRRQQVRDLQDRAGRDDEHGHADQASLAEAADEGGGAQPARDRTHAPQRGEDPDEGRYRYEDGMQ